MERLVCQFVLHTFFLLSHILRALICPNNCLYSFIWLFFLVLPKSSFCQTHCLWALPYSYDHCHMILALFVSLSFTSSFVGIFVSMSYKPCFVRLILLWALPCLYHCLMSLSSFASLFLCRPSFEFLPYEPCCVCSIVWWALLCLNPWLFSLLWLGSLSYEPYFVRNIVF